MYVMGWPATVQVGSTGGRERVVLLIPQLHRRRQQQQVVVEGEMALAVVQLGVQPLLLRRTTMHLTKTTVKRLIEVPTNTFGRT